jgi:serpin B
MTLLTVTVCTFSNAREVPDAVDTGPLVKGNTAFALDLYRNLREREGNLFLSPYSISTALAMTYAGARGDTEQQMATVLNFTRDHKQLHPPFTELQAQLNKEQSNGKIELSVANALWAEKNYSFLENFIDMTNKNYGAPLSRVDFKNNPEQARTRINEWVEQKTNDKIKDLIKPGVINALTRLVLTNAIYFRGNWTRQFKESATKENKFWIAPDKAIMVPLMTQEDDFAYGENENMQILELPYVGNSLSMIILLPKTIDGLSELETTLTVENLTLWTGLLSTREIRIYLPKCKMTSAFSLKQTLSAMGMPDVFTPKADFSGMTGNKDLFISAVIHKAFVDIHEEGTEAAAATAVTMRMTAMRTPPSEFRADHPFLFLIRHNPSGSILFLGRVTDPTP